MNAYNNLNQGSFIFRLIKLFYLYISKFTLGLYTKTNGKILKSILWFECIYLKKDGTLNVHLYAVIH